VNSLAVEELPRAGQSSGKDIDTSAFEIEMLHEAFGPALPMMQQAVGLQRLATRGDLDTLARRVQRFFWEIP
jgi:hypothetical protein